MLVDDGHMVFYAVRFAYVERKMVPLPGDVLVDDARGEQRVRRFGAIPDKPLEPFVFEQRPPSARNLAGKPDVFLAQDIVFRNCIEILNRPRV